MGSVCGCFNAKDPAENNDIDNSNSNKDEGFIPRFYNKIKKYAESTRQTNSTSSSTTATINGGPDVSQSGTTATVKFSSQGQELNKSSSGKVATGLLYYYPEPKYEEECLICLEEYTRDNPKITTQCSHCYHLGCIYDWMERNETCPICSRVIIFNEMP